MTKYFLVTHGNLEANADKLGKFAIYPVDNSHRGPFSADDMLFFCQNGGAQDFFLSHSEFQNLPDPLRGGTLSQTLLDEIALADMNLTTSSTMFDLIDQLTQKSKDFALKI